MPSSSISAGNKLDTTPSIKIPIHNTLRKIIQTKFSTVVVVRLALVDRCGGLNGTQFRSDFVLNPLSCLLICSPMPEPFGNPDCNEIAEGKSGRTYRRVDWPSGVCVCLRIGFVSCPVCVKRDSLVRPIYSAVCFLETSCCPKYTKTPCNIFTGETL